MLGDYVLTEKDFIKSRFDIISRVSRNVGNCTKNTHTLTPRARTTGTFLVAEAMYYLTFELDMQSIIRSRVTLSHRRCNFPVGRVVTFGNWYRLTKLTKVNIFHKELKKPVDTKQHNTKTVMGKVDLITNYSRQKQQVRDFGYW